MADESDQQSNPQYSSFPMSKIYPDRPLPGDLFLFLGGHFVKYKNQNDTIDKSKYELFLLQKVQYIFVLAKDLDIYLDWAMNLRQEKKVEILKDVAFEHKKDMEIVLSAEEEVKEEYFNFISTEVTSQSIQELVEKTRNLISAIKEKKSAEKYLAKLLQYDQGIADHSMNVANLSVYLAMNIGYAQQLILENIYNGALMHDYGKVKIEAQKLEDPTSPIYQKAILKHPDLGKTTLLLESGFNDEVLRIIHEHHEANDGTGYPRGLKGNRIYDLSKIVTIANEFDNRVLNGKEENITGRQIGAFRYLESDQGKLFDPKILGKCLRALERVLPLSS
jgi:putative nucleotidyltransferase with HDIG domain